MIQIEYKPNRNTNDTSSGVVITGDEDRLYVSSFESVKSSNPSYEALYTNPGYQFVEWNTEADGSGLSYGVEDYTTRNLTLYAIWESQLNGSTWVIDSSPTLPSEDLYIYDNGHAEIIDERDTSTHYYGIHITTSGINYYTSAPDFLGNDQESEVYDGSVWESDDNKSITFTLEHGSSDSRFLFYPDEAAFMTWLQENAELQYGLPY